MREKYVADINSVNISDTITFIDGRELKEEIQKLIDSNTIKGVEAKMINKYFSIFCQLIDKCTHTAMIVEKDDGR